MYELRMFLLNECKLEILILILSLLHFVGLRKVTKPERGLKLNVLTQNGFIYHRLKETSDRIFWRCAFSADNKCLATYVTNKTLRVIDNQQNKHTHDKSDYESLKRSFQQTTRKRI